MTEPKTKKPFITEKDYQVFRDNDDCLETCIRSFHEEMPAFLEKVWDVTQYEENIIKLRESKDVMETFNEIINGMLSRKDELTIPIGMIPGGSGNSLLHDLGLTDPISAAKAIVAQNTRLIDTAEIEMDNIIRYSINLIGWGLVTDVGKRAELLRWFGPRRYTVSRIIEILLRKNRQATLVIDDKTFVNNFTFIVACNSIHIGKGMKMAPYAKLDDGLIDLIVVDSNITRKRLFSVLPKLFDGTHVKEPEVTYHQASSFSILPQTDDILNIDGEMAGTTPITVKMLNHSLEIFA